jgi:predicted outer membrane protein
MSRLAILLVALAACSDNTTSGNALVDIQLNEGHLRGQDLANQATVEFAGNDPVTMMGKAAEIMLTINNSEIDEANLALSAASATDVLDFASRMVVEHNDWNARLLIVRRDLALPSIPNSVSAALQMETAASLANLRLTPPGPFDVTYMQIAVMEHAEAEVILDQLASLVPVNAEFDTFIADFRAAIDNHLVQAETILSRF